jgi:hypothetical protein
LHSSNDQIRDFARNWRYSIRFVSCLK